MDSTAKPCSGELTNAAIVILSVSNVVLGVTSVCGNLLILAAIYRVRNLRTVSNAYIGSMAVADFSVGLIMNPLWLTKSLLNVWRSDNQLSTCIEFLTMQIIVATTFSLCAVTVDRYFAVTNFRYIEIMTWSRTKTVILFIWVFSIFFACLRFVVMDPSELPKLWISATIITVITPLIIISICYCFIFKATREQIKRISSEGTVNADQIAVQLKNRKAAFTIGIIVGVFALCWTPSLVISVVQFFTGDPCDKLRLNGFWFWAALAEFSNSAVNPFIYSVRSREFRKAIKRVISFQ